jgi:ribulose kinase
MSRQYKRNNLRWRMDNCLCLCAGHHFRWSQKNEAEWRAFLYEHIGLEKVLSLEWEALHGDKPDIPRAIAALAVRAAGTAGRTGCTVACGTDGGYVLPASEADPVREGWGDDE